MPLAPGTRLGQYEIVASIGAGGMGEVYRAHDARLDRDVALKVLSADLAHDPSALTRFEREALSVAKLSHPNILAIHQFGSDGGIVYVVTELVDGETLRARLVHGPLPARRAVGYAMQIARGIAAAHARGVVHRDLKPENVMVARDDQVKILDFGLAKEIAPGQADLTRVADHATSAGTVLGTFGYMAPEQVRGLAIDHRADIFALGAVLYEMLSGERAFRGETAADTMSAVLTKDPPDLDAARLSIPAGLDRIFRRCLENNHELRFQSATDLAFALDTLSSVSNAGATAAAPALAAAGAVTAPLARRARASWLPWTVAVVATLAALAAFMLRPRETPEPRWASFTRISEAAGEETSPAISPDGTTVAYAMRANGSWDIYAQRVGGRNATPIVNDPQHDESAPAFSPDGSLIAFHRSDAVGGIFVAGATGESVRRVTDNGFDPAWSPDGRSIAFGTEEIVDPASRLGLSTLYVVDAAGGTPRKLVDDDGVEPAWSPSGSRIAYWSNRNGQRDLFTVAAQGGEPVRLTNDAAIDWCPAWSPDGKYIYFSSDRGASMNLWRMPIDESSGRALGEPEPVTTGVQASAALPRLSKDGTRLVFRSRVSSINPVAIPIDPSSLRAGSPVLLDTQNNIRVPSAVSPDGSLIAYFSIGEHQEDIFVGSARGPMRRVTDDAPRDRAPVFSPDGRSLLFYSNRDTQWGLWTIGIDGGGLRKVIVPETGAVYVFLSPKGDELAYLSMSGRAVFTLSLGAGTPAPRQLDGTIVDGKYFTPTDWSPDGTRLAGALATESGRPAGVAVYDMGTHVTTALNADEAYGVKWLPDGRHILYFTNTGRDLVAVDTTTRARAVVSVALPGPSINDVFAVSPDGRTVYYGASRAEADIWIVERR